VTRRRLEVALWALAVIVLILGWMRWREAGTPPTGTVAASLATAPAEPFGIDGERLTDAGRSTLGGNPFRLDRAPAPVGQSASDFDPDFGPGATMPAPPPFRPPLAVSGIAGPPWRAVLDGVPGREGGVVVARGDELGDLRIRDVTATTVVVVGSDTTWRLHVKTPWQ
jgi:hypothetical protein